MGIRSRSSTGVVAVGIVAALVAVGGCSSDPQPSLPPAPALATTATVESDGLRVTLVVDGPGLEIGIPRLATVTVRNLGADDALYGTDDCGLAVDVAYRAGREWAAIGPPLVGSAAEFKDLALTSKAIAGSGAAWHLTPERFIGVESWACGDALLERRLPPGEVIEERLQWDAWPGSPSGPVELAALFGFIRREHDPEGNDDRRIEVLLQSAIIGGVAPDRLGPAGAVDAALADEPFAAFLASAPRNTWIGPRLDLDRDGRIWRVGLFVERGALAPRAYGEVAIDGQTGLVVGRRFEPPFR
jgi:hypothetical protein